MEHDNHVTERFLCGFFRFFLRFTSASKQPEGRPRSMTVLEGDSSKVRRSRLGRSCVTESWTVIIHKGGEGRYCGRRQDATQESCTVCFFSCVKRGMSYMIAKIFARQSRRREWWRMTARWKTLAAIPFAFRGTIVVAPVTGASVADAPVARRSRPWSCSGTGTTPRWTVTVTIAGKVPVLPLKFGRICVTATWFLIWQIGKKQWTKINQSIIRPNHKSISQTINQSINQSIDWFSGKITIIIRINIEFPSYLYGQNWTKIHKKSVEKLITWDLESQT